MHSGICTFCFDNFVSTFNIHVAAQLKILAQKVEVVIEDCIEITMDQKRPLETDAVVLTFKKLRDCVQQHLTLIYYVRNMQRVFAIILLGQLLLSSVVICFGGFQFLVSFRILPPPPYFTSRQLIVLCISTTARNVFARNAIRFDEFNSIFPYV